MGGNYDPVFNNCQEFANDLCCQLSGKGFMEATSPLENMIDVTTSMFPPGISQGAWLLMRPSVWLDNLFS